MAGIKNTAMSTGKTLYRERQQSHFNKMRMTGIKNKEFGI